MRTYRLWYALDVVYEDSDPGDLENAIAYGEGIENRNRGEQAELMKAEKLE